MSRLNAISIFTISLFVSVSALAFEIPAQKPQPFLTCVEAQGKQTPAQVEIAVTNFSADSIVRVEVRETRNGSRFVTLNDLLGHPEHANGIYQNYGFRLQVSPQAMNGNHSAHIDFLQESGVRSSAELVCTRTQN